MRLRAELRGSLPEGHSTDVLDFERRQGSDEAGDHRPLQKVNMIRCAAVLLLVTCCSIQINARDHKSDSGVVDFCEAARGELPKRVTVRGIYIAWFETSAMTCREEYCSRKAFE